MRGAPRSLAGRLLLIAGVAGGLALAIAAVAIGGVLERFVMGGLDRDLDRQIAVVARAVRPDGGVDPRLAPDLPPFDRAGSGWAWQVRAPGGTLRSRSLGRADLAVPATPPGPPPPFADPHRPRPFDAGGAHGRVLTVATRAGPAAVIAAAPRALVARPLRAAMAPLLAALAILAAGLALAVWVQLRVGLRPLRRIGAMLAEVREGRRGAIDADAPAELAPLVAELNALIAANAAALARARGHVANLAHGLKTPLATLRLDLAAAGDAGGVEQVERIERQIRHHLGRARAATPAAVARPGVALAPRVADIVDAVARIHTDRAVAARVAIAADIAVRCDPQDLDEMLGNIVDNGWRWARSRLTVTAARREAMVEIAVSDDGPGLPPAFADAISPGRRADERGEGFGFGLAITRELAGLSGGMLSFADAAEGGACVRLSLPGAIYASVK